MEFPQRFGKYELLDRIATGGMAEVFLARQTGLGGFEKRLVIKRIRPELADDPHLARMFIAEARIGVQLNHPNVVAVHELGRVGSALYIAMEWLHGRDLTRLVKALRADERRLPTALAVHITAEVCRGLGYAHARADVDGRPLGLVHQDVSPHNVLVTFDGHVKLVDFGIARAMHSAADQTRTGGGKVAYMSPEQARGDVIDHRADLFSAGILLWELLANRRLYKHADPDVKLRLVRQADIPDPRDFGADLDPSLWSLLQRVLAREPDDRPQTAAALEEDLRAWLFDQRARVGPGDVARTLREAFPAESLPPTSKPLVDQVAADLARLDQAGTRTPTPTPNQGRSATPLPGNLSASRGERRAVVTLLLDFDGITDLSARLDPEPMFRRHLRLLRWVRGVVDRWGGVVQQAVDDQVTVLFGVPRAHGDEVARALDCALELRSTVTSLRNRGLVLEVAAGVHVGDVTVGYVGSRIRYLARGDTTRLARRLASLADAGEILVSARIFDVAESVFVLQRGPEMPCRGARAPLPTYRVAARRRGVAVAARGAWVRRGDELEALRSVLADLAEGRGARLALCGEPGTGRTRLLSELHHIAERRGLACAVARCTPWGGRPTLAPLADIVVDALGVEPGTLKEPSRLADALSVWGATRREADVLASLAGQFPATAPDADEIATTVARLLDARARHGAFLVCLDDVHHLPSASRRTVAEVARRLVDRPVGWLWTSTGRAPEGFDAPVTQLGPLGPEQVGRLLASLLDADQVDATVVARIVRLSEGNARYVEELARLLVGEGHVRVEGRHAVAMDARAPLPLPPSLAALIAARIDALDAPCRGVLQLAAIAGATFEERLVQDASGLEDVAVALRELAARGLIARDTEPGTWSFASDLVREIGLRGILGVQRGDYHRLVAAAIERQHPGESGQWTEELARHLADGGRRVDAARAAHAVGERYERAQDLPRAKDWYALGLEWITKGTPSTDEWDARVQGEATLRIRLGAVLMLLGDAPTGERHLKLALDIASDAGLPWIELRAHLELARTAAQRHRMPLAHAHIGQARALLSVERDPAVEREVLETAAVIALDGGRPDEATALWQRVLQLAADDPAAAARAQVGLASRFLRAGEAAEARALLEGALPRARASADRILEGRILNNLGLLAADREEFEPALALFREAITVREGVGYQRGVAVNHHNLGDVYLRMGQTARAHVAFERSRELAVSMGWTQGVALNDVYLGFLWPGPVEEALARIDEAAATAAGLGDHEVAVVGLWLGGRRLAEAGQVEAARLRLAAALDAARAGSFAGLATSIERSIAQVSGPS